MELIRIGNSEYEEYEELLLRRDRLRKEAGAFQSCYIHEFGELICSVFRKKIACIEKKKIISRCQLAANRGETLDYNGLNAWLNEVMGEYYEKLKSMTDTADACRELKTSSELTILKCKKLYRQIAKLIHPDMNPYAAENPTLMELWQRVLTAYHTNDLQGMQELEVLTRKALEDAGSGSVVIEIPNLTERIAQVRAEIEKIITTDPYCYGELLDDQEAVAEKRRELEKELASWTKYEEQLQEILKSYIREGGTITWHMS